LETKGTDIAKAVLVTIIVSFLYVGLGYLITDETFIGCKQIIAIMSVSLVPLSMSLLSLVIKEGGIILSLLFNASYFVAGFILLGSPDLTIVTKEALIILLTLLPSIFILIGYKIKKLVSRHPNQIIPQIDSTDRQ
jgi:hypothetical protein